MIDKKLLDHAARAINVATVAGKTGRAFAVSDQVSAAVFTMMQGATIRGEAKPRGLQAIGFDDRTAAERRKRR